MSRFWLRSGWILLVMAGIGLALAACSTDSDPATDGDAADGDTVDGDAIDGDIADGDLDEESEFDADPEADIEPTEFRMGFATADVSPPLGTVMGGFGAPGGYRDMEEINDPLLAQVALFVNDAGQAFIIISQDTAGYSFDFGDWGPGVKALRESISEALSGSVPIAPQHIMLGASHSHASTDLVGFWQDIGEGVPKDLLDWHVAEITAAAVEAAANLQPVTISFASTELVGFSGRDYEGLTVLDNSVTILRATSPTDEILLTLALYAKHPTTLGDFSRIGSADFIWGFRTEMSAATGAPAMFLQGFEAAVHWGTEPEVGETELEQAYYVGKQLADAVLAVDGYTPSTEFDIQHRWTTFSCAVGPGMVYDVFSLFDMPKRAIHQDGEVYSVDEIEVSWHKLGSAEFVAMPGEPTPEYGFMVRERVQSPFAFPVALANDSLGYILDEASQQNEGLIGYELKMGLGAEMGLLAWQKQEELGWFYGAYNEE
jgi:hypothetical protein